MKNVQYMLAVVHRSCFYHTDVVFWCDTWLKLARQNFSHTLICLLVVKISGNCQSYPPGHVIAVMSNFVYLPVPTLGRKNFTCGSKSEKIKPRKIPMLCWVHFMCKARLHCSNTCAFCNDCTCACIFIHSSCAHWRSSESRAPYYTCTKWSP